MTVILADIGGTHARLTYRDGKAFADPVIYRVKDFISIEDVFDAFIDEKGITDAPKLYIATAAVERKDKIWHFTNNPEFFIDPVSLESRGWKVKLVMDDFKASARGCLALGPSEMIEIQKGFAEDKETRIVLGAGTGLGLAYMIPLAKGGWHVHETLGGHMLAAGLNEYHNLIIRTVARVKDQSRIVIYEDMVSGFGLVQLYKAICLINGHEPDKVDAFDIIAAVKDNRDKPLYKEAIDLFHEFLGLYAHHTIVTGHSYGGLYLDGGVLWKINEEGLFDWERMKKYMILNTVDCIKQKMQALPVHVVNGPFVALQGLMEYSHHEY